jgi:hypothetical protein
MKVQREQSYNYDYRSTLSCCCFSFPGHTPCNGCSVQQTNAFGPTVPLPLPAAVRSLPTRHTRAHHIAARIRFYALLNPTHTHLQSCRPSLVRPPPSVLPLLPLARFDWPTGQLRCWGCFPSLPFVLTASCGCVCIFFVCRQEGMPYLRFHLGAHGTSFSPCCSSRGCPFCRTGTRPPSDQACNEQAHSNDGQKTLFMVSSDLVHVARHVRMRVPLECRTGR